MSTTVDDYTSSKLTSPDPYQNCWGNSEVADDVSSDSDEDSIFGFGDSADFWMADS